MASLAALLVGGVLLTACVGNIGEPGHSGSTESSANPNASPNRSPTGNGEGTTPAALIAPRVRRLTNDEIDVSVQALLGTQQSFAAALPHDIRQKAGFTRNADAVIDSLIAAQLETVAESIAAEAVTSHLATLAPCTDGNQGDCAATFIKTFGSAAFRRPVTSDEVTGLVAVYHAGTVGQTYGGGIQLVLSTMLQSADFLYVTELGDGNVISGASALTSYEVASQLSYFITGGPPDAKLLEAATANTLQDPTNVATQARRLLATDVAQKPLATFVQQWAGVDSPTGSLQASMVKETAAFVDDVFASGDGTLATLLTANYTFVDASLAQLYGLPAPSGNSFAKVQTPGRRGLLNQASFLATFAHGAASAPVKRGHALRSNFFCQEIPPPDPSLKVDTTPPAPSGPQTTRQATAMHSQRVACATCHNLMDPIGFGFEHFDGNGAYRSTENGQTIDDSGSLNAADDVAGPFANGDELLQKVAKSTDVAQCYDRGFFRFVSAQASDATETAFFDFLRQQPESSQSNVKQLLVAFVQTDLFLRRSAQ